MNAAATLPAPLAPAPFARSWQRVEDFGAGALLAAMVALPIVEILFRAAGRTGLAGAGPLVQHLTLLAGMAGGAIAARDGRLIEFSSTATFLPDRWQPAARIAAGAVSAAVSLLLGLAAAQFVQAEREAEALFLDRIPLWFVQAVLPVGFAALAGRLVWRASARWAGRSCALAIVGVLVAIAAWGPLAPGTLVIPGLILLVLAAACGAPVYVPLGGAALLLFHGAELPVAAIAVEHYRLVTNPALPSIPLFTLAGCVMAEGGAARRLVDLTRALVGWLRGGPAIATALLCAFFTALTGGSGVTILALGGLLMPVLLAARYSERDALGLITGAGSLGILLPPCLPVILYAVVAKVSFQEMFLAGLLPTLVLFLLTVAWGVHAGRRASAPITPFRWSEARRAIAAAKWELLLPVVALGSLFSGFATPVEAAAITAAYAFVVGRLLHRDLDAAGVRRALLETAVLTGSILLILGVALGLTSYLIDVQGPDRLAAWANEHVPSRWVFLLALNVLLVVVGSVVEIYAAIVVIVPLLIPVGATLGLHPVHLGIIFLANMELGFLAPPVGLNILLSATRLRRSVAETARAVLPLLLLLFLGVLLITYVPALSLALPGWLLAPAP